MPMKIKFSDKFLDILKKSERIAVSTGAGVSAESGVPTFRGEAGIWKKFKSDELATFEAFQSNPQLVWEWYQHRREIINNIKPNPGHYAIGEMAHLFPQFYLITQNVDGLHGQAGSKDVIELHGNIKRNRCLKCGKLTYNDDFKEFPPKCPCGGALRPDVVWFGELLPVEALESAERAVRRCDIFFSVGTSGVVRPAANLPYTAKRYGAYIVEINLEPSELTYITDEHFHGKSGEILPIIVEKIKELKG
jgi:NAD-dependent deacetylase